MIVSGPVLNLPTINFYVSTESDDIVIVYMLV